MAAVADENDSGVGDEGVEGCREGWVGERREGFCSRAEEVRKISHSLEELIMGRVEDSMRREVLRKVKHLFLVNWCQETVA